MDKISLVGIIVAIGAILLGQVLEGGHVSSLVQPTAFLIVVGGTVGAVLLQSPAQIFFDGLKMVKWVFVPPRATHEQVIRMINNWSVVARRDGLLVLERNINQLDDPFMRRGLQMLVDGLDPEKLREALEVETDNWEAWLRQCCRVWESAGGYSPTIGILGAVLGLIHVMENLSDPTKLGAGIAVAFVATIYGVGLANLVLLPISKKLSIHISAMVEQRGMFVDGLVGIASGDNPRIIEARLQGYLPQGAGG
ncbi:flagellar motor protein [Betaproteobacteria bacterium]|nr:flagellar motor protein [Betaproteobacteria bacterium]GHT94332.1 flagellar motor protein [Betaproteobacteria bacterium]GHU01377.1 flagellar motor protein [Betaproteobacteria bacterium]GHU10338.1 flagellar motor protein [Betaproteobacteria bacterium]GHU24252.1 flagellar motor protein [Betaproteobacteria bacterium]